MARARAAAGGRGAPEAGNRRILTEAALWELVKKM